MTKKQLQEKIGNLNKEIMSLRRSVNDYIGMHKRGTWVPNDEYRDLLNIKNIASDMVENSKKLRGDNTKLLGIIESLSNGVMRDLSRTIVNLKN